MFDGVFGASDEVLGSMESGVDFERRLNNIYNTCRTEREIAAAFDELQKELEEVIIERIESTRKSLLENFDEEVVNKLRVRQSEDTNRMGTYNRHLWYLATNVLSHCINNVNNSSHTFTLNEELTSDIPVGTYILNKESDRYIQLRYGHPLGQYIVQKALGTKVSDTKLVFDLIACAQTDNGEILPHEFIFKLLELDCISENEAELCSLDKTFKNEYEKQLNSYKLTVDERTNEYVDYEINKYEMWAEDQLVPLRKEVMELSREHDVLRRQ